MVALIQMLNKNIVMFECHDFSSAVQCLQQMFTNAVVFVISVIIVLQQDLTLTVWVYWAWCQPFIVLISFKWQTVSVKSFFSLLWTLQLKIILHSGHLFVVVWHLHDVSCAILVMQYVNVLWKCLISVYFGGCWFKCLALIFFFDCACCSCKILVTIEKLKVFQINFLVPFFFLLRH